MNTQTSLAPENDLDDVMRSVARNLALGIYPLETILEQLSIPQKEFELWKAHPRFLGYLKSEKEEWVAAANTPARTKLKAGIILEDFMLEAGSLLSDNKLPLNHRVELGKLLGKLSGIGEPKMTGVVGGAGGGFQLQINIGTGAEDAVTISPKTITAKASAPVIELDDDDEFDSGYDPLVSPNTLED